MSSWSRDRSQVPALQASLVLQMDSLPDWAIREDKCLPNSYRFVYFNQKGFLFLLVLTFVFGLLGWLTSLLLCLCFHLFVFQAWSIRFTHPCVKTHSYILKINGTHWPSKRNLFWRLQPRFYSLTVICKTQIKQLPFLETYSVTDYSCCFKRNIAIPYNKVEGKLQLLLFLFTDWKLEIQWG